MLINPANFPVHYRGHIRNASAQLVPLHPGHDAHAQPRWLNSYCQRQHRSKPSREILVLKAIVDALKKTWEKLGTAGINAYGMDGECHHVITFCHLGSKKWPFGRPIWTNLAFVKAWLACLNKFGFFEGQMGKNIQSAGSPVHGLGTWTAGH